MERVHVWILSAGLNERCHAEISRDPLPVHERIV